MYSIHHFTVVLFVYITSISSALECNLAKSCIGSEFNDLTESIKVQGYMAAFGPTTKYVGSYYLWCNGAYACSSMEFIKQSMASEWVMCQGSNSCSNTTIRSAYNQNTRAILCYGYNACMGSNIYYNNNTAMLQCAGYRSCAHANIYGVSKLWAIGSLSLYRAVIDTIGAITNTVIIYLDASYAAYGAHLICRPNHICQIHCESIFACYNLYIDCMSPGGDNCEIISPNIPNSNVHITNLTDFNTISYDLNIFTDFQDALVEINTDILCTKNGSYDSLYAADANITLEIDEKGPICCRGRTSCSENIIKYETQKKTDLICSGSYACRGSYISNINDTVFCEGHSSCHGSMIRYIDYLYCVGVNSCDESDIIGARYIKCDGSWSCMESTFRSNGVDLFLYLNGYFSGQNTIIYCDKTDICTVNCIGYYSCKATQMFCDTDAVNCIINCDIGIVGECPIILVNGPIWNTSLISTTSIDTTTINITSINTTLSSTTSVDSTLIDTTLISTGTSIDTTTINVTSINTTSIDSTLIGSTSINTTSIDSTLIGSTSINTTLSSTRSVDTTLIISMQGDKKGDKYLIVIAVVIFLIFLIIMMLVSILRSRKKQKNEEEINNSMLNASNAAQDDMMQKNKNALKEKQSHEVDNYNDENEVQIASAVDELQKEESSRIAIESFVGLKEWSHVQVAEWVKTVNNGMFAEYVQSFIDNEIDGDVLYDITPQQLQLGLYMNNMVKRLEFYNLIQTLKHDKNIDEYAMNNNVQKVIQPISELQRAVIVEKVNDEQGDDNENDEETQIPGAVGELQEEESLNDELQKEGFVAVQKWSHDHVEKRNNNNNLSYKIQETETAKSDEKERALFSEWLTNKVRLPQYYNLLVENGYETLDFIKQVTNEELKDIGIYKKGHLLKLIKEIKGLQSCIEDCKARDEELSEVCVEMETTKNINAMNNNIDDINNDKD